MYCSKLLRYFAVGASVESECGLSDGVGDIIKRPLSHFWGDLSRGLFDGG